MYSDASGRGNSDQTTRRKDNPSMPSGHIIKSFRCSFCERGFPNAQALGGHMNIHRKDRAKLKEFSDNNFLSLDITKTVDFAGEESPADPSASEEANSDEVQDLGPRSKHNSVRSLPLFAVSDDERNPEKNKMELMIHGGVDLELRLGNDPHHDAEIKH